MPPPVPPPEPLLTVEHLTMRFGGLTAVDNVSFALDRKCKLTCVKVIPVADLETNKYAHAIWHLVSESNSVPTKGFIYGMTLPGMHPSIPGATADPLEPNVAYRLIIETHDLKGQHDFKTTERIGTGK